MKINFETRTLMEVHSTSTFKKQLKKISKQGKDLYTLKKNNSTISK